MNRLEPLAADHDRAGFDCGSAPLNEYLQRTARQAQEKGLARIFVLVDEDAAAPKQIAGYFSLSSCSGQAEELPPELAKKFPRTIPAVLLGRLAVDRRFQGRQHGSALLYQAMKNTAQGGEQIGIAGMFVDAKDDKAAAFYLKFGFVPLPSNPHRLFLPMKSLQALLK